ncbi:DNA-binding protein [Clostridium sp. cel8]|uniref:CvfB family protein n=1 Tax=unclassified Clostridium TaxID=2614128 RepID=UPI0015F736A0|nr:S1-like domain-containing RNA-binding protein [Clostridium sp. cel8]MBA5850078.1 DNA-binding protein [Clostridium sp. cel8]
MIKIGKFNNLKIVRKADFGFYLDAGTGNTDDDILLPNGSVINPEIKIGDEITCFIYRDSKDRMIATMKTPLATVGDIAYLKVVSNASFGSFIDIGLERDVFVPMAEQKYKLIPEAHYLFYIYVDKTNRLAATTNIDKHLKNIDINEKEKLIENKYRIGDEVLGIVYGFQTNGTVMVAIDNKYRGIILKNEYFFDIVPGQKIKLRIKKFYEDGKLVLTPRQRPAKERISLEDTIVKYLKDHNGFMKYNDKSSPEEIRSVFHESKNYFKNALGGLMKKKIITQDKSGTRLIKQPK